MYTPLIWVAILLPLLLILERWIHRHLRGVSLLLMGQHDRSIYLYALVLLPGVFLHESSHWLVAKLLGVRTGRFSIFPRQQEDGSLQLGYVEYYRGRNLGPVRESLIGAAPLLVGTLVIVLIGRYIFQLSNINSLIQTPTVENLIFVMRQIFATKDVFIWLYLLFAISNAMMPSPSDRRAWPLLAVVIGTTFGILLLFGAEAALLAQVVVPLARVAVYVTLAFTLTVLVDLLFIVFLLVFELVVGRISGRKINYY